MGDFVPVAKVAEFEDIEIKSVEVDGQIVAVALVDGTHYAFDDTCSHAQCSLADGDISGTTVICPCHDGEFDMTTGEVLDGPPEEPINVYQVKVLGDEIQIEI